jgi:ABC-2 type transport system permease protein
MRQVKQIAIKEVRHILRDPRSLIIAILMPIMMTLLYGYAINLDIKNIKLAILDFDRTAQSRELIGRFYNSGYFTQSESPPEINDPEIALKMGTAGAILVIKSGLGEIVTQIKKGRLKTLNDDDAFELGLIIDGADANTASAIAGYSGIVLSDYIESNFPPGFQIPGILLSPKILYNPDLKSSHFFVPGLIAVILMMISALLTSVTIAREKETGTMEQLLTAPVTPRQIIIGKVLPYIALAILDGIFILAFAVTVFGVPFNGSILLLFLFGLIYVIAALAIGIFISTLVKTQQLAMLAAQLATVLPSVMLSGFIFEIKNMPIILQYITHIVPARYFIAIIRGIMLKGAHFSMLWIEGFFLIGLATVLLVIAVKKFQMKIG